MTADEDGLEEDGGGYLVSVSDLMIGLLFVFLLMLMAFALQYRNAEHAQRVQIEAGRHAAEAMEHQRDELRARIAAAEEAQHELQRQRDALQARLDAERRRVGTELAAEIDRVEASLRRAQIQRERLLADLQTRLLAAGVDVEVDAGSGVLRLPEGVLFRSLSADLPDAPDPAQPDRPPPRETVRRLAAALADVVPCYAGTAVRPPDCPADSEPILEAVFLEGHTDRRPISGGSHFADNYELSTARALSTYRVMSAYRPGLLELRNEAGNRLFGLSGYGPDRPINDGNADGDMAANRRIDVRFLLATPPAHDLDELRRSLGRLLSAAP